MKAVLVLAAFLALSACTTSAIEMPANNGEGTDQMKPSPCACEPVPFNGEGYRWLG